MRTLMLAAAAMTCLSTLSPAFAGEGNGPNFPGYQAVDVSQSVDTAGQTVTITTINHAANAAFQDTPSHGLTPSGSYTSRMLSSMSLQRGG